MKIIHLVESFAGGVITSVSQLCNLQANDGNEVYLVHSLRPETPIDYQLGLNPKIKIIKLNLVRQIAPIHDLSSLLEVIKILKLIRPDVLHLHSSKAGFIGRTAAFFSRQKEVRVFYSPRGFPFLQTNVSSFKRLLYFSLEKIGAILAGTIVACSASEAGEAVRLKAKKIAIVENAVDVEAVPFKYSLASVSTIKIGTLGRLSPQKNPRDFKKLAKAFITEEKVEFMWIGGGEDYCNLCELKNVMVTGWLPRKEALQVLSQLDIYVQTSLWEGMPLSVIEAMLAGIPVIVRDAVGNRDVVEHGKTGFVASSPEEMLGFTQRLLIDSKLRLEMGKTAQTRARDRFCLGRLHREIKELYSGTYKKIETRSQESNHG